MLGHDLATGCQRCALGSAVRSPDPNEVLVSSSADSAAAQPPAQMVPAPDSRPTAPAADEAVAAPRRGFMAAGWAKFSDNVIPSLVVTVIVGLVIFSFDETSDRITRLEDDIDARFTAVDARFTKLEDDIDARFTSSRTTSTPGSPSSKTTSTPGSPSWRRTSTTSP